MLKSSVALCSYNGARHIAEQIGSILSGTRLPDEIVIHDDRSTDETANIVSALQSTSPVPIRFKVNDEQLGPSANFAGCALDCSGDVIFLADQDDAWMQDKLERFMAIFDERPDVGGIFSDAVIVDEHLNDLGSTMFRELDFFPAAGPGPHQAQLVDIAKRPVVTGATFAFRRELVPQMVPVPIGKHYIHDGWMAAVTAAYSTLYYFGEPLICYRQHPGQLLGRPVQGDRFAAPDDAREGMATVYRNYVIPLNERLGNGSPTPALLDIRSALAHSEARCRLPPSRLRRLFPILRELTAGRYRRYSRGVRSAAKDLLSAG